MIQDTSADDKDKQLHTLLETPDLADALESEQFRRFLDQVPVALVVSEIKHRELVIYANPEFEKLSGQNVAEIVGNTWNVLHGRSASDESELGATIITVSDFVGTFKIDRAGQETAVVDAYSNVIQDDSGTPAFRLAALVDVGVHNPTQREELEKLIREKDALLREIQHRVKNNLQMITALLRIEARNARGRIDTTPFDRLAGRIGALQVLYSLLSDQGQNNEIDLGVYLSEIASSVLRAHAVEGIRLDLKVDAYPVSVDMAMPTGLVVNELLTNAIKHAFVGRDGGTITLQSLTDGNGCRVVIADNGVGLPQGAEWPRPGKLSALIVNSLRENAKARLEIESIPGQGMSVTITFTRSAAAPVATAEPFHKT